MLIWCCYLVFLLFVGCPQLPHRLKDSLYFKLRYKEIFSLAGNWLSGLERSVHIRKVGGSNPPLPIFKEEVEKL